MSSSDSLTRGARILVTGGAGFIGSHLIDRLLLAGPLEIVALDSLHTGSWTNVSSDARIRKVTADFSVLSQDEFGRILHGVDFLFHLAAEKHNQSLDVPERVLAVNIDATYRLLRAAAAAGVRKVIFTSSLYAAGGLTLPPMSETDLPQPTTVYGVSKLAGEHLLHHLAVAERLRSTAFRLFFVYGPRQFAGSGYKSVIVRNFERILRDEAPVIAGDGTQSLDYVHVSDVTRALVAGLQPSADGEMMHIGSGTAISVNDLTALMLEVAGSGRAPVYAPADWTAGTTRACTNRKAASLLGWTPAVAMRPGLAGVYDWMKGRA